MGIRPARRRARTARRGPGEGRPVAGYCACALYVIAFAILWGAQCDLAGPAATAAAIGALPTLVLAAILLDASDLAALARARLARIASGEGGHLARTRLAAIATGKLLCWCAVPAIALAWAPELWSEASGANLERPRLQVLANGRELFVEGPIRRGFATRLAEALDRNPGLRVVSLESEGGLVEEAIAARSIVSARGLDTYVAADCASACVDLFLAGRRREALPGARFRLHHPGFDVAEFRFSPRGSPPEGFLAGLPEAFRDRALATPYDAEWEPRPDALLSAGVITAYVDGSGHALAPRAGWRRRDDLRRAIVEPRLLSALGPGARGPIDDLVSSVSEAILRAAPHREVSDLLHRATARLVLARIADADDATVADAGALIADAMAAASEADGPAGPCARIGASADLVLARAVLGASGRPGDPVRDLLLRATPLTPAAPLPARADREPRGTCAAERASYAAALGAGVAGVASLRARFSALARPPEPARSASADPPAP